MASKFSPHQNILQPKRLNSAEVGRIQKGIQRPEGPTLTLNGVTIGLPSNAHHIGPFNSNPNNNNNTTPAKKGSSTMAKRNARERNRVKQVNQGFQTLRQHIPDSYRMKKMSKVDTLRCALDYIRSMEHILEISPKLPSPSKDFLRDSSYQTYSSTDMNQHLDKICSMEETLSISLDQSFSSFSENEESSTQGCLNSSSENENHNRTSHFPLSSSGHEEPCESIEIVTAEGNNNNGPFHSLASASPSSNPSIILPVQLQSHSHSMIEDNVDMIQSDENFNPPSTPFIRVVEIIQLQQ